MEPPASTPSSVPPPPPSVAETASTFAAFRNATFRWLWVANVVSGIGSMMHGTAAAWMLAQKDGAATWVTLLQTMISLPVFLFALPAGVLADLLPKRSVVLFAQAGGFLVAGGLALLAGFGSVGTFPLLATAFLLGAMAALGFPAWQAMLPELVTPGQWPSAITLGSIAVNLSRSLGPIVGGLLIGLCPAWVVFSINAASFLAVCAAVWQLPRRKNGPERDAEPFFSAMAAAVRHIRHTPAIRRVLGGQALYVSLAVAPVALLPLLAKQLGLGGVAYGLLLGVYGVGGILTAFLLLPLARRHWPVDRIFTASAVVSLVSVGGLAVAGSLGVALPLLFLAGGAWMTSMSQFTIAGQSSFPHWVRARASAVQLMVTQGAFGVGALLWGQLTQHGSLPLAFGVAGGGLALAAVVAWRRPLGALLPADLSPHRHVPRHERFVRTPRADDGPVLVSVTYEIDPADEADFFRAMDALRSVRLRDGAFRWGLYLDMNRPRLAHEVFLVDSWAEHLRQHERFTVENARIEHAALRFHRGPEPPAVTHCLRADLRPSAAPLSDEPPHAGNGANFSKEKSRTGANLSP